MTTVIDQRLLQISWRDRRINDLVMNEIAADRELNFVAAIRKRKLHVLNHMISEQIAKPLYVYLCRATGWH